MTATELPAQVDTVVIGGGQAGLAMSWTLTQAGREHVVLEARDRLGGSWLKRWDTFCLVTPNFSARLPGFAYDGPAPEGFMPRDELVDYITRYGESFGAPVVFGARATALRHVEDGGGFRIGTAAGLVECRNVVVATGAFPVPKVPAPGSQLPSGITQVHTDAYRNERELPSGGVLVVGSGQSGCQIVEELHGAGRDVYLAVSSCWRAPRRYRGQDTFWWFAQRALRAAEFGIKADTVDDLPSPKARFACNPHLSGKDGGHTINLRALGSAGVTLLGHLDGVADGRIQLADDLDANLMRADTFFNDNLRPELDEFIDAAGYDAPPGEFEQVAYDPPIIREVDLAAAGISTVIWATGYRLDFGWIEPVELDEYGYPRHVRGLTEVPGLHFLGLPWLHTQTSSLLVGVGADAAYLAERLAGSS